MSLNYVPVLSAVRTKLLGSSVISTNIGKIGDASDQWCVYVEQAPAQATYSSPTLVITKVSEPMTGTFAQDQSSLKFDVHLFYGREYQPYAASSDCGAIMDEVRSHLNRWQPTPTGITCSTIWQTNSVTVHDEASWHWVSSFSVEMTDG